MQQVAEIAVEAFIYGFFCMGICSIYKEDFRSLKDKVRMRRRLRERRKQMEEKTALEKHLDCVANATLNTRGKSLMGVMMGIFSLVLLVGSRSMGFVDSVILALVLGAIPYILLRIKFEGIRRKSSFEGEMLVSNFLNQYRITHFNVYEALEKLLEESKTTTVSNPFVLKMLLELQSTGNPKEIRKSVRKFAQMINTNWSRMLAYNIQLAAEKGINVSLAIEDILLQLRDARMIYEERKRLNSEAIRIVVYMIPILYVFTVIMSLKFIGLTIGQYVQNQLFTKEGFLFLSISSVLFLANIALMEIVSRQKFDY